MLKTVIAAAGTPAEFRRSTNKMAKCFAGVGIGDVDFVTMIDTPKQSWPWGQFVAVYHGRNGYIRVAFKILSM